MLSIRESFSSTTIFFPDAFMSAGSICGGEMTTLLVASSSFINSSNVMVTFFDFTPVPLSAGSVCTTLGGVSSYQPPSGCPILAHETIIANSRQTNIHLLSFFTVQKNIVNNSSSAVGLLSPCCYSVVALCAVRPTCPSS